MKKLYIIESLREEDEKTGKKISDIFSRQITTQYYDCDSISDFKQSFLQITDDVNSGDEVILSIEVHGDREGIQLSDMSLMSWNEVASLLKDINIKTEMGLYVLTSSCFGLYLDTAITIKDRAPFYKSYGPDKKIEGDCIVRYNSAIIRDFIEDHDISQTIDQENSEPNKTNAVYMACDCVQLYKKVAIKYYKENLLAQNVIVRGIINMPQIEVVAKERGETIEETVKKYVCMLLDKAHNESLFYKFMDRFLMTDKNSPYALEKASLTFDECWTDAWQNSYKEFEMENTVEVGTISGKKLYRSPIKNADHSELEKYFSVFNFMELALAISKLAKNVYCANDVLPNIKGTSYNDDILCRALELAIKYASKDNGKVPNEQDIINIGSVSHYGC